MTKVGGTASSFDRFRDFFNHHSQAINGKGISEATRPKANA